MEDFDEVNLYNKFLNGDNNAFNEIVIKYQRSLINFIFGYVHNLEVSKDLAQDTFLYILINKKEYDFKYSLKTYLYLIAKCRCINYLKKESRKVEFKEIDVMEEVDFNENIIKEKNIDMVRSVIKNMKPDYQVAIFLRDFQNFTYKEISRILNKPLPQTKILIYRARKSLKRELEKEGFKYE